jgi:cytidine deaminase
VGPNPEPLLPCGACRQVLLEFNPDMAVICVGTGGQRVDFTARDLLPASFNADDLKNH